MSTLPTVLQPLADKITSLEASVAKNTAGVNLLASDIKALIAKLAAGGTISAADVQPLLDRVTALGASVDTAVAEETASDASVNPPTPTP